jgi:hypothetical protein
MDNGTDDIVSKVDLEKLIQKFRPTNPDALEVYLEDVWKDLSERDPKKSIGITKQLFLNYYNLPLIIGERLFKVLDTNNHSSLSEEDFVSGLLNLFLGDYKTLVKIMFNIYDYNKDGKISKKDVKIVFNYIPLKPNEIYQRYKIKYEGDNINDRKESMNEINKVLDKIFEEDTIDEDYFKYSIENINSDLFIFLLVFLYEKRPFNDDTIDHYKNLPKKSAKKFKRTATMSNSVGLKLVVSPTLKSKFRPAAAVTLKEGGQYTKFKSNSSNLIKLKFGSNSSNHLKAFGSGLKRVKTFNIKKIKTIVDEQDEEYEDESSSKRNNQKKNVDKSNMEDEENEEEDIDNKNIKYEGYLIKIRKDGELKKLYFKLLYHDLYFFKSQTETEHGGVHNLCDVFIKEGNPSNYNGKYLYCFSIIYPEKERKYYTEDKKDYQNWIKYLRKATDYEDLYKSYEMKDIICKGRYGTIRVGYHKIKKRFVAIKIINKKAMSKEDMENIRNQINILKIVTDEFVLKLLDIIENESYLYIMTELCKGGDLYSYLNQRSFKISEEKAAKLVYKLAKSVSFLHTLGIIHRDLKPENILMTDMTDDADIRISDFCICKRLEPNETTKEIVGTLGYMAPEVLMGKEYNFSADVWAIGVIAYLLLTGYLPFDDEQEDKEVIRKTLFESIPFYNDSWKNISSKAKDFIKKILKKDKEERITIEGILSDPWFENFIDEEEEY